MARGGNNPVNIPDNVKVSLQEGLLKVEGPNGKLKLNISPLVKVEIKDNKIILTINSNEENIKALHGTFRAKIANMVLGVTTQFTKVLQIEGVGYKAAAIGNKLTLNLGFTHPIETILPQGITAAVEKQTIITLKGSDKEMLGNLAASLRKLKDPDPYKAKGIRYLNEYIRRKVGKTATTTGAGTGGK